MTETKKILIPADVPLHRHDAYTNNYNAITNNTGRLFLFAYDQKIEHLNTDFYGEAIHPDALSPHHPFNIARDGRVGALATHLGLIARYANQYPTLNYVAKLNGKTNLVKTEQQDPNSAYLYSVSNVLQLIEHTKINIRAIGITLYIGSEYENSMMHHAAQSIFQAHQHGLCTILWVYPRGKTITDDADPQLIAGAAGVGHALGADFVKIKPPHATKDKSSAQNLKIAAAAAGNTGILCAGGTIQSPEQFLQEIYDQIHIGNAAGCAIGRNIFQRSTLQAINMTHAIASLVLDGSDLATALKYL